MKSKLGKVQVVAIFAAAVSLFASGISMAQVTGGPYSYFSVTPCRIADTRSADFNSGSFLNGSPNMQAGPVRAYFIKGTCGIPDTARAVSLNAVILNPTAIGFLSLWPAGGAFPTVSTINFLAGEPGLANGAIVPLKVCASPCADLNVVYGNDGTPGKYLDFVLDATGYFQ